MFKGDARGFSSDEEVHLTQIDKVKIAKAASAYAGVVFGIYWIPIRALENAGFPGVWASVALNAVPLLLIAPVLCLRGRRLVRYGARFHLGGLLLGLAYACYTGAFLFTEIVNVIVLYYLLPLWGFLLARLFMGESITPVRWASMFLGFIGIMTILGPEQGMPVLDSVGDLMALASGFLWALGSLFLLLDSDGTPVDCGIVFIFWGTMCAALIAVTATIDGALPLPRLSYDLKLISWLVPVALFIVIPASFATVYGPMVLNPGVVGLLFMTEISVGTVSAAILTNEQFGLVQILGVLCISSAGLLEICWYALRSRSAPS